MNPACEARDAAYAFTSKYGTMTAKVPKVPPAPINCLSVRRRAAGACNARRRR